MKRYTVIGLTLSLIWLATLGALVYLNHESAAKMTLNEWGDLFGGSMAPLALLWLVLGYMQQGEELRLNTEALKSQQIELQKQTRETAALVESMKRQATATEELAGNQVMRDLRESLNGRR